MSIVVVDLDSLVETEATIKFQEKKYKIVEFNGYKWAEFQNKVYDINKMEDEQEKIVEDVKLREWMVKTMIPSLDQKLLNTNEFIAVSTVCQTVISKGCEVLGKKLRPLEEIIKRS